MKFWNVCGVTVILSAFFSTNLFAQPAAAAPTDTQATVTIADAQKAYVAGKWKEAAAAYEAVCPKEPDSVRAECYLWNVLALSQIGAAKDFSKAGKRLDSLRNEKAAEALIHAIETSQPHQAVVLQKVCTVVQSKVKNATLDETCKRLDEPAPQVESAKQASAPAQKAEQTVPETAGSSDQQAKKAEESPTQATAPAAKPVAPAPAVQPAKTEIAKDDHEYWILQLGAFGVRSNAELLVNNLKKQGIKGSIEERQGETKTLYLVQTGKFETKEKAIDFGAQKLAPLNVEFRAILKKSSK